MDYYTRRINELSDEDRQRFEGTYADISNVGTDWLRQRGFDENRFDKDEVRQTLYCEMFEHTLTKETPFSIN